MLKTRRQDQTTLVTQPAHAQVAGYFAAHWGNDRFAAPGHFAVAKHPNRLRAATVQAVTLHDNGWWEWENAPDFSPEDGYPMGLAELLHSQQSGMERWRIGLPRLAERAPYAALIAASHARWLYAPVSTDEFDARFLHPLFWQRPPAKLMRGRRDRAAEFVGVLDGFRDDFSERLRSDPETADWVNPEHLLPHVRLQQLADALSLSLTEPVIPARDGKPRGLGEDAFELHHVPRESWNDLVTLTIEPVGNRTIVVDPYPFDLDPMPVFLPVRTFSSPPESAEAFSSWWQAEPIQLLEFTYRSR